jgi:mycofactocin system glycosyltransferase
VISRFTLDASVRRDDDGTVLIGGSPLRMLRLSAAGARVLDGLAAGEPVPSSGAAGRLVDRLLDAGIIHPVPDADLRPYKVDDVTVVVPVRDRDPSATLGSLGPDVVTLVVDDGSDPPRPAIDGVELIRRPRPGGPGAARNAGLARVSTPLVAFVDSDCEAAPGWLDPLLAHFADPRVAAVAPRIVGPPEPGPGTIALYETVRSPLDLGPRPGPVRPGTRISYVPAAALLVRTDAARSVAGFDDSMHVGEDVDFVWRLDEAGWRVRYEPAAAVRHHHRIEPRSWLGRRVAYGESAAALDRRHPGGVPPLAVSRWSLGAWGLAAVGSPAAAAAVAATSVGLLAQRLRTTRHPGRAALRIAGLGNLHAGRMVANALVRPWWPVTLVAALVSRRARRVALVAATVPALLDWRKERPPLDPVRYVGLRVLDDLAYGLGVWRGAIRHRTPGPLLPVFPEVLRRRPRAASGRVRRRRPPSDAHEAAEV